MPSRQDQLHSYQFAVQRVIAALVMRETDPAQSPFRRTAGATLASALIAVIALGGVAVYGVFVGGGSTKWRSSSVVIVEQESGARFVYLDGKLHPVVNQASALLIVGSAGQKPVRVSRKSIAGKPRGVPLGIPDAPDPLPVRASLAGYPWTVCSAAVPGADSGPRSTLMVGVGPAGGVPLGDRGLLVRHPGGDVHLVWNERRHLVRDTEFVRSALGWASQPVIPVAPAMINSMPAGADLELIDIPGRGEEFSAIRGAQIGEVFVVKGQGQGGDQYAVAMRGGLAAITEVQLRLLLADPETSEELGQQEPTALALSDFAAIPKLNDLAPRGAAPPATTPELAAADTGAVCAVVRDDAAVAEVRVQAESPRVTAAMATGERSAQGAVLADYVQVEAGRGAVVEAVSAAGVTGGTLSVVTDLGRRYAVPNADVLGALGFGGAAPVRVPASLVALLPAGPALDPEAARAPVSLG
jgi:type VII secretion protein EccB